MALLPNILFLPGSSVNPCVYFSRRFRVGRVRELRAARASAEFISAGPSGQCGRQGDPENCCQIAGWSSMRMAQRYTVFEQSDLDELMVRTASA
jgi:hypothetical protein